MDPSNHAISNYFPQIPTYFPNDSTKRIDYVIAYKRDITKLAENGQAEGITASQNGAAEEASRNEQQRKEIKIRKKTRKIFLKKVEAEGFETEKLEWLDQDAEDDMVYILLHCKLERLFKEAEKNKLQLRISNVNFSVFFKYF